MALNVILISFLEWIEQLIVSNGANVLFPLRVCCLYTYLVSAEVVCL